MSWCGWLNYTWYWHYSILFCDTTIYPSVCCNTKIFHLIPKHLFFTCKRQVSKFPDSKERRCFIIAVTVRLLCGTLKLSAHYFSPKKISQNGFTTTHIISDNLIYKLFQTRVMSQVSVRSVRLLRPVWSSSVASTGVRSVSSGMIISRVVSSWLCCSRRRLCSCEPSQARTPQLGRTDRECCSLHVHHRDWSR